MKKKTIEKVITKKFKEFLGSITDDNVKKLVEKNSLISGGCIASMLMKDKVNDFDIYFTNKETVLAVANYFVNRYDRDAYVIDVDNLSYNNLIGAGLVPEVDFYADRGFKEAGRVGIWGGSILQKREENQDDSVEREEVEEGKFEPVFFSPNAISLTDKIQLILRFYGTAEEIHTNYDYVHCTNYWLSADHSLHLNQPALESILARELVYVGSKYPIASILRTRKFLKRGWTINAGMYLKMSYQVSKLNLDDISVLEDQLVGVDVAYFATLIEALREAREAHKDDAQPFVLNYGYLSTLINRIFE